MGAHRRWVRRSAVPGQRCARLPFCPRFLHAPGPVGTPEGRLVRIGVIGRPHGVRGELSILNCSLTAEELGDVGALVWRGRDGRTRELTLESVRPAGARLLACARGVSDREQAAALVGGELLTEAARLPDPGEGVAYAYQIVGLEVRTADGRVLGPVAEVMSVGGNTLYVVRGARELMIPAVPEVVHRVDLEAGVITVTLPPGLEDL